MSILQNVKNEISFALSKNQPFIAFHLEDTMLIESEDWLALMEHVELEKIA